MLHQLQQGALISASFDLTRRSTRTQGGIGGMMQAALPFLEAGKSVLVVRDLDALAPDAIEPWFAQCLDDLVQPKGWHLAPLAETPLAPVPLATPAHARDVNGPNGVGRIAVVAVGLPDNPVLRDQFGVRRFAMDDFLLLLAIHPMVYGALSEIKKAVPHALMLSKLGEIKTLMDTNRLPLERSKRHLQLYRAVAGFRASPAEFAKGLLERSSQVLSREQMLQHFAPLLSGIALAESIIRAPRDTPAPAEVEA